jgi:hypothetical protein
VATNGDHYLAIDSRHAQATAAAGARIRRYGDRRIDRSRRHFAGCRSTGRLRAPLTIPPSGTTFSTATSRSDVLTTRLLEDALARKSLSPESPIRPRCVLAPAPSPPPSPPRNIPTRATSGRASSRHSRDLKTARSLRQGEDHLSGIPRFGSEPRQNRSSATKGSRGMRSRVRRRAPVRFCWKRRHDMGSLIDICNSCSSPQVSA